MNTVGDLVVKALHKLKNHGMETVLHRTAKVRSKRIVFHSKPDFSDNARKLFEHMVEKGYHEQYEMVWLVEDPDRYTAHETAGVRFVMSTWKRTGYPTTQGIYHALTCGTAFFTHGLHFTSKKKEEQTWINLWHGSSFKESKSRGGKYHFDGVLVPGPLFVDTKARYFGCPKEKVWPLGYPRYDSLRGESPQAQAFLHVHRAAGKKVLLWMPTYRQSTNTRLSEATLESELDLPVVLNRADLTLLDHHLGMAQTVLFIKQHRLQKDYDIEGAGLQHIRYLKDEDLDQAGVLLYELLPQTDGLITDYSSVGIDYLLVDKPMAFTLDDYAAYREKRGFIIDDPLPYMAGHHIHALKDLLNFIEEVRTGKDEHREWRQQARKILVTEQDSYADALLTFMGMKKEE